MENTVSIILAVMGAFMTLISVTVAIFTFYFNRKKESGDDGAFKGSLKTDIEYIKKGVDELKADNKDIKDEVDDLKERIVRVEDSTKSAHKRLDAIDRNRGVDTTVIGRQ